MLDPTQAYADVRSALIDAKPYSTVHALQELAKKWGVEVDQEGRPVSTIVDSLAHTCARDEQ